MVYSARENSELPLCRKYKHTHVAGDARCCGQYQYKHVTLSKLQEHREEGALS
jgi:hypothetical protein